MFLFIFSCLFTSLTLNNLTILSLKAIKSPLFIQQSPILFFPQQSLTTQSALTFSNLIISKSLSQFLFSTNFKSQLISIFNKIDGNNDLRQKIIARLIKNPTVGFLSL